jgi:preprotein translocase subunit Sec63
MTHFFIQLMSSQTKDYYLILQVQPSAEPEVIQAAYRRLALKYHPDVKDNNPAQMQELNEAYEVLSSPDKRAAYDRWYRSRQWRAAASSSSPSPPTWSSPSPVPDFIFPWRTIVVAVVVMFMLAVFVLDVFRIGLRGAPEITLLLILLGIVVYKLGGIKDLWE